uniref:Uncharacterized protein n=1 Tax=Arundo donax TaxID=35708 RepID=A0A0A8Y3A1_ARUDO
MILHNFVLWCRYTYRCDMFCLMVAVST